MDDRFAKALKRKRESKYVEFKESFDPSSTREWCEVIKDIVAIGNTGGGVILFGVKNNGTASGKNVSAVSVLDPATLSDKIFRYTRQQISDFHILDAKKDGKAVVGLVIGANPVPVVFEAPGTYPIDGGMQKTAFSKGSVYFRHGAKSEPGTTADIRDAIERRVGTIRDEWLAGVRKVVSAPSGSHIAVVPGEVVHSANPDAFPIRLSEDPKAPVYRVVDVDDSYPYRQKEVIEELNRRTPKLHANTFDILCARRVHGINKDLRYCHTGKFTSPQYSEAFVDWLESNVNRDPQFFERCRRKYQRLT